jgi:PHD/YefM family antitoxin component YafN of YafNO toxin-antitoxin module
MEYQYVTDKVGKPVAIVVPLEEWEALQSKVKEECLSDKEIAEAEHGWKEYLAGKAEPVEQVKKELLDSRND